MERNESRELAVFLHRKAVRVDGGSGTGTFKVHFVNVLDGRKVRNLSDMDTPISDLTVGCQWNTDKPEHVYAFDAEYRDVYSIDLRRAEGITKILRTVNRFLEKSPIKAETFGQFVSLVAQSLKVRRFVVDRSPRDLSYMDEGTYDFLDVADVQSRIDSALWTARYPNGNPEKKEPSPASAGE